jgi:hypothetical protein
MTTRRRQPVQRGQREQQTTILIPENVSEFYANSFTVGTTPFDFVLFSGSVALPQSVAVGGNQIIRGQIRIDAVVRMSPQHAKASLRLLTDNVNQWEATYGEIQIPAREVLNENTQENG